MRKFGNEEMIMIKTIFILILLISFSSVFSQKEKMITDNREVILNYPDSILKVNILLSNKKIKVKNDLVYYWFNSKQVSKNLGGYTGRVLNGKYIVLDMDKNMLAEGHFKNGLKHGTWKRWNKKGGLLKYEEWKKGRRNGLLLTYDNTGRLAKAAKYKNDLKHGWYIEYNHVYGIKKFFWKGVEIDPEEGKIPKKEMEIFYAKEYERQKQQEQNQQEQEKQDQQEQQQEQNQQEQQQEQEGGMVTPPEKGSFFDKVRSWFKKEEE